MGGAEERKKCVSSGRDGGGKRRKLEILKTLGGQGIERPLSLPVSARAESGCRRDRWVKNDSFPFYRIK